VNAALYAKLGIVVLLSLAILALVASGKVSFSEGIQAIVFLSSSLIVSLGIRDAGKRIAVSNVTAASVTAATSERPPPP
jgi:uncharacterized membrane protein (DUF441 family)